MKLSALQELTPQPLISPCTAEWRAVRQAESLASTSSEPSQHRDDSELQAGMSCSTFSECPRDQQHRKHSQEQSLSQVAAENQHGEHEPFQAWSVETGQVSGEEE
jgi:hypothetical protein